MGKTVRVGKTRLRLTDTLGYSPDGRSVGIAIIKAGARMIVSRRVYARCGPWCVTKGVGDRHGLWIITHAPSGYSATGRETFVEAQGLMVLLAEKVAQLWGEAAHTEALPAVVKKSHGGPLFRAVNDLLGRRYSVGYLAAVGARGASRAGGPSVGG